MSYAGIRIVEEFFRESGFLTRLRDDVLLARNTRTPEEEPPFVVGWEEAPRLRNAVIKPVCWHTLKFTPAVLRKSPEIFHFLGDDVQVRVREFFGEEAWGNVLVIPGFPGSETLREESMAFLREKGISHVLTFPAVITGLVKRINPRQVYLSEMNEVFRVLKFYGFFAAEEEQPDLPFKE